MNKTCLFISLCFIVTAGMAQNIDSFLAHPPVIELSISNPQPRLNEEFVISYDPGYIQAQIFKTALGKLEPADRAGSGDREYKLAVKATRLGKETLGPFSFILNGVTCTTTAVSYEVIPKLPDTAAGIWIRHVKINDSLFCILVEQRIPSIQKTEKTAPNETRYYTEAIQKEHVEINYRINATGVRSANSTSNISEKFIYNKKRERLDFQFILSVAYYQITDRKAAIEITRDWFEHLPVEYTFTNIKVQ